MEGAVRSQRNKTFLETSDKTPAVASQLLGLIATQVLSGDKIRQKREQ